MASTDFSKIVLTFNDGRFQVGDIISFRVPLFFGIVDSSIYIRFVLVDTRIEKGQMRTFRHFNTDGNLSAYRFRNVFNLDYNGNGIFLTEVIGNELIIKSEILTFDNFEFLSINPSQSSINVTANIINNNIVDFSITNVETVASSTDICNKVSQVVSLNRHCKRYTLNNQEFIVNSDTVRLDYNRDNTYRIIFYDNDNNSIEISNSTRINGDYLELFYKSYSSSNIKLLIRNSISGGNIVASVDLNTPFDFSPLFFTYSIDGVNYSDINTFSGQPNGSGTVYVKDQFGCVREKEYTVDNNGIRDDIFFISQANSINFVKQEHIDNCNVYKTDYNTFSCNSDVLFPYNENILFNTCDSSVIQFKSNFPTLPKVFVRKLQDNSKTQITVNKLTTNLNRYSSLDCMFFRHPSGKLGVYFTTGNTYDAVGIVSSTHSLQGGLPEFAYINNDVILNQGIGTLKIDNVLFFSEQNRNIILFNQNYDSYSRLISNHEIQGKISSRYDLLKFEIYEFSINWSLFNETIYDVVIQSIDSKGNELEYISENIELSENHINTVGISYYNRNNRDVFYKFGIKHFIRVEVSDITGKYREESEVNVTDNNTISIFSSLNESDLFLFENLVKSRMRTLSIALSCENVFINGVRYLKETTLSIEKIPLTNIYKIEADLIKAGDMFTTYDEDSSGVDSIINTFDSISLLRGNGKFIKL